jgi:hypothetical protein
LLDGFESMAVDHAWVFHEQPVQAAFLRAECGVHSLKEWRFSVTVALHVGDDCSMCAWAGGLAHQFQH